ncbi:MAG: M24 family metallopeptidase, partial [Firmicutes bacterium]|nr:M24 family metallopeptidase [Bacillota bacterium]
MKNCDIETLPVRKQHEICDEIKLKRLETLLPEIMEESGIDMWLILAGEYNEDPVFFSLVPSIVENASRMTCLAVVKEKDGSYGRYSINKPNRFLGRFYRQLEFDNSLQWQQIVDFIKEKDPKTIGINTSPLSPLASGLSAALHDRLVKELGPLSERLVCADELAVRWIETRTDEEMAMYPSVYEVTTQVMNRAFSREVIVPGITTTDDVEWWVVEEFNKRGLPQGFRTAVNFQRCGEKGGMLTGVIRHGDLLHYDAGIRYLGLATDHQRLAYVLKPGETEAPKGIMDGFRQGRRFSDLTGLEMQFGRTGNEVFHAAKTA